MRVTRPCDHADGFTTHPPVPVDDPYFRAGGEMFRPRRRRTSKSLPIARAVPYEHIYGSLPAYVAAVKNDVGREPTPDELKSVQTAYNSELLDGCEVFLQSKDNAVPPCFGDSGGPLLRMVDGKLTMFGVLSWIPRSAVINPCKAGSAYATFGPSVRALLEDVSLKACGDVPVAGRCEGSVAARCIAAQEAHPGSIGSIVPRSVRSARSRMEA